MFLTLILSAPVYLTFFWALVMYSRWHDKKSPQLMIGNFLFVSSFVFFGNFLFYTGVRDVYTIIDPIFILATVVVHPMYYVYFLLLTKDPKFSFRKHFIYFIPGLTVFLFYLYGSLQIGFNEYMKWLFSAEAHSSFPQTNQRFMDLACLSSRILFLIQGVMSIMGSIKLIRRYRDKPDDYYSNMTRTSMWNLYAINVIMILIALISILDVASGRDAIKTTAFSLIMQSSVYSILMFALGWIGHEQSVINPTFEAVVGKGEHADSVDDDSFEMNERLILSLEKLFADQMFFRNSDLTIHDVAERLGTNRTKISKQINKTYKHNFCTHVNRYRFEYAEKLIIENPDYSFQDLSDICGFGSSDSLKRTVGIFTGLSLKAWKSGLLEQDSALRMTV